MGTIYGWEQEDIKEEAFIKEEMKKMKLQNGE